MKFKALSILLILWMMHIISFSQEESIVVKPTMIGQGTYHGQVGPLSDIPPMTMSELRELDKKEAYKKRNQEMRYRYYPNAENAFPKGDDEAWQKSMGSQKSLSAILENWAGQSSYSNPPDDNGTAGPNHYMQTINVKYTIYDKQGTLLAGPTNLNTLFAGVPGANNNDGDPIILYDEQADRWLVAEFSGIYNNPDYMLIAISTSNDPTGTWDRWSFVMNGFPDYMKFGIWRDGYYMGTNTGSGDDIYVFERDVMLAGGSSPQMVQFNNPNRPNSGFHCVLPIDNDGAFAPSGTPGGFITINDDAWGGGADAIWIFKLNVNWTTPANSTFQRSQVINVTAFDSNFGSSWENIRQPGTSQKLDAINQILMHRAQYRNFGGTQTIVCNHTVDVDNTDHAGIRWYELEYVGTTWQIRQQGTYAPDAHSRWMGSIAMNANHEIGLAYSVSSSSVYPGIRYTGQSASANAAANGLMDIAEETIWTGTASQTSSERWGDYANLALDPNDDATFWFTTQYNISGTNKGTRIASFALSTNNAVVSNFVGDPLEVVVGGTVSFTDMSTYNPDTWDWTFEGGTPSSSSQQNPTVTYNTAGVYDVSLHASNADGGNTMLKTDYITVVDSYLTVSPSSANVSSAAGSINFNVQSNISWTINETCSWLTLAPTSGTGSSAITINYQQNTDVSERQCIINVEGGAFSETYTLTQAGATPFLNINPISANVGQAASTTSFTISSNIDWTVSESCPWVTVAPSAGTGNASITVSFQENTGSSERECLITIEGGSLSQVFTLTQAGSSPFLNIDPTEETVDAVASSTTFAISSNIDWTVTESCSWLSVSPSSGSGNQSVTVAYNENTSIDQRICEISVDGGSFSEIYTLTQLGAIPYLSVNPSNESVGSEASTTTFDVSSNLDWIITESCSWLSVNPSSGSGNQTITVTYGENLDITERTCEIDVEGGSMTATYTLTQEGAVEYLDLDIYTKDITYPEGSFNVQLTSNTSWVVSEGCDWLAVTPTSGSGNASLTVNYNQNTGDARSCEISVANSNLEKNLTVNQEAYPILVDELENADISIFPNPAQDFFRLETSINLDRVVVIDALGKIVLEIENPSKKENIDTHNWEKGSYFIKLIKGNTTITQNLQVQ